MKRVLIITGVLVAAGAVILMLTSIPPTSGSGASSTRSSGVGTIP